MGEFINKYSLSKSDRISIWSGSSISSASSVSSYITTGVTTADDAVSSISISKKDFDMLDKAVLGSVGWNHADNVAACMCPSCESKRALHRIETKEFEKALKEYTMSKHSWDTVEICEETPYYEPDSIDYTQFYDPNTSLYPKRFFMGDTISYGGSNAKSNDILKKEEETKMENETKEKKPVITPGPGASLAYGVKNIILNPPAMIVFWNDNTKTVVKCREGETFNPYYGFCAALAKKVYGCNARVNKIVDKNIQKPEKKPEKEVKATVHTTKDGTIVATVTKAKTSKNKAGNNKTKKGDKTKNG